jgi:hypothetical protein
MYACSPRCPEDWMPEQDAEATLSQLAGRIKAGPYGPDTVGVNSGLHFTGGEPFLNFDLLLKVTEMARDLGIPSTFVETNCFWCTDDDTTREKLLRLRGAGIRGILISVNPFILEQVPFERTQRAVRIGKEIYGGNAIVYQELFYQEFTHLGIRETMPFEEYLRRSPNSLQYVELLPMGRAPYKLGHRFRKYHARHFFGCRCREELSREWHIHIDNYGNYMPGFCGGISLGNVRELDSLLRGIDLKKHSILRSLVTDIRDLYEIGVENYGYEELNDGYVSKCHLCVDLRKHIAGRTDQFSELEPRSFYRFLQ